MKFVGKFLLTLLLLVLLLLVIAYVSLQTRWGAGWASRWISDNTDWHLSVSKIEHNFSSPGHVTLDDFTFGHDGEPAVLVAKNVDLGFALAQFSQPGHFDTLLLKDGTLDLANLNGNEALPLAANRLQLSNMVIRSPDNVLPLSASAVNGGVLPWQPKKGDLLGDSANFQMSAGDLTLYGVAGKNVLIQGRMDHGQLQLNNIGADLARGSLTGNAGRDAVGNWRINNLRLNDIRLQTSESLQDFLRPLTQVPSVQIDRLDITDARLQGPEWAITDLDLSLKNIRLHGNNWESDDGSLEMNASNFINGSLEFIDPIANMHFTAQGIDLDQFSTRFVNGLIRTNGSWTRNDKTLVLDELVIAGLEYTLPQNWRARWQQTLPGWLQGVEVKKLSANRNLLIDVNPDFPFQLTALDGTGSELTLARHQQWGIWRGTLSLNAAQATFNRTDLRHPSLALTADDQRIKVTEMSAFVGEGMLEGLAVVDQNAARALMLNLNGRAVPANVLQNWGWPALPLTGNSNLTLKLNSSLATGNTLKASSNGELHVTTDNNEIQQSMTAGEVK